MIEALARTRGLTRTARRAIARLAVARRMRLAAAAVTAAVVACAATAAATAAVPDLSGYWDLTMKVAPDPALMHQLPPHTVVLHDTGPVELPRGDFGGLKIKPQALAAALAWKPMDDMMVSKACQPPSIIYAMQGPFPMEIYQGPKFIIMKLAYYDMVRIIFMDGRTPPAGVPDTKVGYSVGHWDGSTLVVETTHLEPATITNNGLDHSDRVRVLERFKLGADGKTLLSTQEFDDPEVLDAPGARFIAWRRKPGRFVPPYDCDPSFVLNYQQAQQGAPAARRGTGGK
ncbi:MAG: hypothetical protein ACREUG_02210 [Steroidobacteraceae bacterium]